MPKEYSPSTLHPSRDNVYKSFFCIEDRYWDATIKVDYDNDRNPIDIRLIARVLNGLSKYTVLEIMVFKTGKGNHLRVWIDRKDMKRIGAKSILHIQSKLNDDPKRQKFNTARVRRREPFWNVLWTLKVRNGRIVSQEIPDKVVEHKLHDMVFINASK